MQTRRQFLLTASAMALTACTARFPLAPRKRPRYVVTTQNHYWASQDLSTMGIRKKLFFPGAMNWQESDPHSALTIVNDDGSNLRRALLPFHYHCATSSPHSGLIYVMGNHRPAHFVALDPDSLEVVEAVKKPDDSDIRTFGGHGVPLPGKGVMAVTMNNFQKGKFDEISLRDERTLKEVGRFSSFGFQIHEIRLSEDGKYFVCAHYGSYLGQGPYAGMGIYDKTGYYTDQKSKIIYPGAVTLVEVSSGKLHRLNSDIRAGQEGHAVSDDQNRVYLPNIPPLITNVKNIETHPRFKEGDIKEAKSSREFENKGVSLGISVTHDRAHKEVIVPDRMNMVMNITSTQNQTTREIDLRPQAKERGLNWLKPRNDFVSGIEFHPDGKHYILSTADGFVAVERGSHKINSQMSFPIELKIHSHMHII